jgi:predicted HTH domain antitoxin
MTIHFDIPREIEQRVRGSEADLNRRAREAFLVELYRDDEITIGQLGEALGLDPYETDGLLKRYGVALELSVDELRAEAEALRDATSE